MRQMVRAVFGAPFGATTSPSRWRDRATWSSWTAKAGDGTCAPFGEPVVARVEAAGLAGFVVAAASRDTDTLAGGSSPIVSAGRNPCGPLKGLSGTTGRAISGGGIAGEPGDLVVGDSDGGVVVPRDRVRAVLDAADAEIAAETQRPEGITRGEFVSPWLDDAPRREAPCCRCSPRPTGERHGPMAAAARPTPDEHSSRTTR